MSSLQHLEQLIKTLRGPNGCHWDQKQKLIDMPVQLLEECHEVIEAIHNNDSSALQEELGDLLFVLLLTCDTATTDKNISMESICSGIYQKMIHRHPHVFAKETSPHLSWEELKQKEKQRSSLLDGIPHTLPALHFAQKQASRVAKIGFDWPSIHGVINKVKEELEELQEAIALKEPEHIEHELGDLLMACANVGRKLKISSEFALQKATRRFARRFRWMENNTTAPLTQLSAQELDSLWNSAKTHLEHPNTPA